MTSPLNLGGEEELGKEGDAFRLNQKTGFCEKPVFWRV